MGTSLILLHITRFSRYIQLILDQKIIEIIDPVIEII